MAHDYLPYSPVQSFLLPPSPSEWLPDGHLAYQVLDLVNELDLRAFVANYGRDGRGAPGLSPVMMVSVLLYAWMRRVRSSRKICALCRDDVGGRVIGGGYTPDHRTINSFRLLHENALNGLFKQSIVLCQRAGMVELATVALDGTKEAANASKRKGMTYDRMVLAEARLEAEIGEYHKKAIQEDAEDDSRYGADSEGPSIPEELKRRETRMAKIRAARVALETEAKAAAEARQEDRDQKEAAAAAEGRKLAGRVPTIDPNPKPSACRNFTDPESRIMKTRDGAFIQAYNGQAMVDGKHQVIIACDLTNQAGDVNHLPAMLKQAIENTGAVPNMLLADPGYNSEDNMTVAENLGVTALIPPDQERCGSPKEPAPELSNEELAALSLTDQMRNRVSTKAGREAYSHRKGIVEPVFGQIKGCPGHPGFTAFLRRGLAKCSAEWNWGCAAHNFLKYKGLNKPQTGHAVSHSREKGSKIDQIGIDQIKISFQGA